MFSKAVLLQISLMVMITSAMGKQMLFYRKSIETKEPFKCSVGDLFMYDCKTCKCDPESLTYILCEKNLHCRRRGSCIPYSSFQKGCNKCTCQPSGKLFCTARDCVQRQVSKRRHSK